MQHHQEQQPDRLVEVDQPVHVGVVQDVLRLPDVRAQHHGPGIVGQQQLAVRHRDRVPVHVGDPAVGHDLPGDLVHVVHGGDAGADVQELPDALSGHQLDHPAQRGAADPGDVLEAGIHRHDLGRELAVRGEVVPAAEQVVVHPGHAGHGDIDVVGDPAVVQRHATRPSISTASQRTVTPRIGRRVLLRRKDSPVRFVTWGRAALAAALLVGTALVGASGSAGAGTTSCQEQRYPVWSGSQAIAGLLCVPDGATSIQLLVPGGTYNRAYWEYENQGVSYRKAQNGHGFATLSLDRLGTGKSTIPNSLTVTVTSQARAIGEVVAALRPRFGKVVLVGHSIGTEIVLTEAAKFGRLGMPGRVDGVVGTGLTHHINLLNAGPVFTTLIPAKLDPLLAAQRSGLLNDLGYVTTAPGAREADFHRLDPVTLPGALEYDESTKDVTTLGEALETVANTNLLAQMTRQIDTPVLLGMGSLDKIFCLPLTGTDCSTPEGLLASEGPYFSAAARLRTFVVPQYGHSFNFAPTAGEASYYGPVSAWVDAL
ncbi:alpha/beta fold hydrolase [Pseudonocardiaceae bacterium YIM PH 21723]|nr:alpha/beta fold hydrolase [Pseudonocardiaceae bacterium YIM PH 21723]